MSEAIAPTDTDPLAPSLEPTALPGVVLLTPPRHDDDRGWFIETFHARRFAQALVDAGLPSPPDFVQDNQSCSAAGVLRGLHYQLPPHAQAKLVRVVRGTSFHAVVDVTRASPTFGRWIGVELSAHSRRQLWIPSGHAHGFLALEDATEVAYKASALHARDAERVVLWNDPALAIAWPLDRVERVAGAVHPPMLSPRDAAAPRFVDAQTF